MKKPRSKFDYINFAYGVGAAIILVAAMFKFLGWNYANEIFIIGLSSEAIVFLISSFQWKITTTGYMWENVFPQLLKNKTDDNESIDAQEGFNDYYKNTATVSRSVETLDKSIHNLASVADGLTENVKKISEQMAMIEKSTHNYENDISHLKNKLSDLSSYYDDLLELVDDKD